jgi:hypothetical protein
VLIAGVVLLLGRQIMLGPDRTPEPQRRLVRTH